MTASHLRSPLSHRARNAARRGVARFERGPRELPTYVIVGAKRAGTTSLNEYLIRHPDVERGLIEKGSRYFDVNFDRGLTWFSRNFPSQRRIDRIEQRTGIRPILGESSPYYCYHPDAPQRMAAVLPDARLIMLVREPVARAWSHFHYERSLGFETLDFAAAIAAEDARVTTGTADERAHADRHFSYVARGRYAEQIDRLHEHFDRGQVLVVESERLFREPAEVMAEVYEHCGLRPHDADFSDAFKQNRYDRIPTEAVDLIAPRFAESNDRLRALCGDRISWLSP